MGNGRGGSNSLGNWAGGDFEGTVSRYRGVGANADLPEDTRFVTSVVQRVLERVNAQRVDQQEHPDLAIFVLSPSPPASVTGAKWVPMLDNGLTRVTGRLWFATPAVIATHYIDLPENADDGARLSYVKDDLDLGSRPTVIYDSRVTSHRVRWYPEGLQKIETVTFMPLAGDVTQDEVFEAMNHLYEQCFITPSGLPQRVNLWNNAARHWPLGTAEALVQSLLKAGLATRFPFCTIRHEQTQQAGRTDLEIEQFNPLDRSSVYYHAILELKVLRSFRHEGGPVPPSEVNAAVTDGVSQAATYRDIKGASWSALCCFDMRDTNTGDEACFNHVTQSAARMDVSLKRWFLYASPAEYRRSTQS